MSERPSKRVTPAIESNESSNDPVFEKAAVPPPAVSTYFLPDAWDADEYGSTRPLFVSSFERSELLRDEFLLGCQYLGLDGKRKSVMPHQFVIADALNATKENGRPLNRTNVLGIPRRGTKSTSVFALGLGRCLSRDGYLFAFTGQNGLKARDRFLRDIVAPLERLFPDADTRPFRINRARGGEKITFDNGSLLAVLPPIPDSWRGDAWDLVFLDEAQKHEPELARELITAISPTFLGRPEAQLVIAGTAGPHRSGLLWDSLERGRAGEIGIVEYAAHPETPIYDPDEDEDTTGTHADPAVWATAHPRLTHDFDPDDLTEDFRQMSTAEFCAEYLNIWPTSGMSTFLSAEKWDKCRLENATPELPTRFAVAVAVHPEQRSASIVAAFRDENGLAHIGLLDHRKGTRWVAPRLSELAGKYKRQLMPVLYDKASSPAQVEIEALARMTPRPKLAPQGWPEVSTAAGLFVKTLDAQAIRHYDQPALNDAARLTIKRGTRGSSRWAFGRKEPGDDITPIEAASLALRYYDDNPVKESGGVYFG